MKHLVRWTLAVLPGRWIKALGQLQWRHRWLKAAFDWAANRVRGGDAVIQRGSGKGLSFNCGPSNAGYLLGTTEPEIQALFEALLSAGQCVYDVGANVGFFSMIAARLVGTEGQVYSFEPLPENLRWLEHNARLNSFANIAARQEALGREDAVQQFLLSNESTKGMLSSCKNPLKVETCVGSLPVAVRRLDSFLKEGLRPPDLIKLDVEGAETDVLAGGIATLETVRPILLIELHGTNDAVASVLEQFGYLIQVVGSSVPIREAHWNAQILALPREKQELLALANNRCLRKI